MKYLDKKEIERVEGKLKKLNAMRPLPESQVKKLQGKMRLEMTYNSNAIEGNSLSLKETYLVVNEGLTVKGKSLKDHLEAKDHHEALDYLYDLVEHDKRHTISQRLIRSLHQIIMQETDKEWAGSYRDANVIIGGATHTPPDALDVPRKMEELIKWISENKKNLHNIELSALLHHKLVYIHPFFDGNGRTSRLAMNILLMQYGFPMVVILKNDRKRYYNVLNRADNGDYEPLIKFILRNVERSLDIYLKTLTPVSGSRERYIPLAELTKQVPYSAEYLNLLARNGKLEAHKDGRNWLSSRESVKRYQDGKERKTVE